MGTPISMINSDKIGLNSVAGMKIPTTKMAGQQRNRPNLFLLMPTAINPNEDMAESISYYIVNPDKLRSRSPAKYEFIQNRVMHGTRYISKIREDLTFEVYNLYP